MAGMPESMAGLPAIGGAGDTLEILCHSWWTGSMGGQTNSDQTGVQNAIASLLSGLMPGASGGKISPGQTGSSGSFFAPGILSFLQQNNPAQSTKPKAHVNWLFLNEQFAYTTGNGSGAEVVDAANTLKFHQRTKAIGNAIIAKQSGYVYIYTSNESSLNVYFDNLKVNHLRGALLEETHYYPFGLTMAGISSRAAGKGLECGCGNKKGYNGNEIQAREFSDGSGLDVYDFNARTYDQQIGRFIQIDPLTEEAGQDALTPYHFSGNNPSTFNDPDGKCPWCAIPYVVEAVKVAVAAVVSYVAAKEAAPVVTNAILNSESPSLPNAIALAPNANAFIPLSAQMAKAKLENELKGSSNKRQGEKPKEIVIDGKKHPQSAQHGKDAAEKGSKVEGVVDRKGAPDRRRENLKGTEKEKGKDRDEFPPAVIKTNGPVSVRLIDQGDNRGSGGSIGRQLKNVPDNTRVVIKILPPK